MAGKPLSENSGNFWPYVTKFWFLLFQEISELLIWNRSGRKGDGALKARLSSAGLDACNQEAFPPIVRACLQIGWIHKANPFENAF